MKFSKLVLALAATAATAASFAQGVSGTTTNVVTGYGACLNTAFLTATGSCAPAPAPAAPAPVMAKRVAASQAMPAPAAPAAGDIMNKGGYVQDARGVIVRDPFGLCWRTAYWSPALAQAECEGGMVAAAPAPATYVAPATTYVAPATTYVAPATTYVAPVAAVATPVVAKPVVPVVAPVIATPTQPAVTVEKVTFAADAFFDTNKAVLKPEAKAKLDDLASKIKAITLEVIIAVGHTDSDASDAYNQKLSVKRAEAVKAYLVSKGIEANRVYTEGKGEKQPVADNKTKEGKAKNRRTEIEVVGTRAIKR